MTHNRVELVTENGFAFYWDMGPNECSIYKKDGETQKITPDIVPDIISACLAHYEQVIFKEKGFEWIPKMMAAYHDLMAFMFDDPASLKQNYLGMQVLAAICISSFVTCHMMQARKTAEISTREYQISRPREEVIAEISGMANILSADLLMYFAKRMQDIDLLKVEHELKEALEKRKATN